MTMNDRLEQFFRAHPNQWVDGRRLAEVAGAYAWRSRTSDLRRQRGMAIENRQRKVAEFTISEYRYVVQQPAQAALLFEAVG